MGIRLVRHYLAGFSCENLTSFRGCSFRRRRLNWPQDHPGVLFEDEEPTEVSPPKTKLFSRLQSSKDLVPADRRRTQSICASKAPLLQSPVFDKADSITVRTIRVFEATKSAT